MTAVRCVDLCKTYRQGEEDKPLITLSRYLPPPDFGDARK